MSQTVILDTNTPSLLHPNGRAPVNDLWRSRAFVQFDSPSVCTVAGFDSDLELQCTEPGICIL